MKISSMHLFEACQNVLSQLYQVIDQLERESYTRPLITLNKSTLGQHARHTIEFFLCLTEGIEKGVVNYDKRRRDIRIETDPEFAKQLISEIIDHIKMRPNNIDLILEGSYSENKEEECFRIESNINRELAYNIEHAVHHMAIIKIGLTETNPAMEIPSNFGVAVSTVRHHN